MTTATCLCTYVSTVWLPAYIKICKPASKTLLTFVLTGLMVISLKFKASLQCTGSVGTTTRVGDTMIDQVPVVTDASAMLEVTPAQAMTTTVMAVGKTVAGSGTTGHPRIAAARGRPAA
jgi:hypothetical protein